jgi:hypothetical protein
MEERNKPSLEDLEKKIDGIEKSTNRYIRYFIRSVYTLLRITLHENLNESDRILVSNRIDELSRIVNDDV